jgi:hypothetical protein
VALTAPPGDCGVSLLDLSAAALGATIMAWAHFHAGRADGALWVLSPLAWLIFLGVVFAVVDVAEDGRLDFGRAPPKREEP